MNVKYTVITYDNVSDTFSISEDTDDNASEDNKEEEEVEELCHDLFMDFAPTRKNKRAKKSNEITIGATSTKRQKSPEKLAYGPLEKLVYEALEKLVSYVISCGGKRDLLEGWSARRYPSGVWTYYSKEGTKFRSRREVARWLKLALEKVASDETLEKVASDEALETVASDEALGKVASDEALEKLVLYVISCGGKRDSLEGWSARCTLSGAWHYYSKEGTKFLSRREVARRLKLPGAPMLVQRTIENIASPEECKEALEKLASFVVLCGGTRDLVNGWSARRYPSGVWTYCSKEGNWFISRPEVARWLELPGAPMLVLTVQRTIENIASPEECREALEKLVSYVVLCGGKRDLLEGWSTRRDTSRKWFYFSKKGNWFKCRPDVARWLNLPGAPDGRSQVSKKRKR
ncbi:hypothetical protein TrCOL_g1733 [Triparma columacea]|uniref:Uncharacterized protein n=1 Tax=Triparma columacea TaxID=722753 RepID=A0A9W7G6P1_9STRA|nr:hypothetical protein TrCOL_g1733 [Triparma columacea]